MFLDHAVVQVAAGSGGDGIVAFRRESGVPHGGPSGGDGGKGGDVIVRADSQLSTLLDYRYQQHYRAERGQHGQGSDRTGRSGEDLTLRVPPGTILRNEDTGELLAELLEDGQEVVIARGGRGGRGNAQFATATNQAPRRCEPGREAEQLRLGLELKLIADVGLVGEPNAGKSTLLATTSQATPKIADYPFTTLSPNLGVVQLSDNRSFVIADIPGIIEGAHQGKGLGFQFLRHIERTRTLALLVPADSIDPQAAFDKLRNELASYSVELAATPHCVVFTKADLLPPDWPAPRVDAPSAWGQFVISSVAHRGLDPLMEALWLHAARVAREERNEERDDEPEAWTP
jgi:GTPase